MLSDGCKLCQRSGRCKMALSRSPDYVRRRTRREDEKHAGDAVAYVFLGHNSCIGPIYTRLCTASCQLSISRHGCRREMPSSRAPMEILLAGANKWLFLNFFARKCCSFLLRVNSSVNLVSVWCTWSLSDHPRRYASSTRFDHVAVICGSLSKLGRLFLFLTLTSPLTPFLATTPLGCTSIVLTLTCPRLSCNWHNDTCSVTIAYSTRFILR